MSKDYWLQQPADKALFEDLIWSRPENKMHAGKLLIVGGNAHGFAAPAEAYEASAKAGIGTARALLPDALQKTVGQFFHAGEYVPSTPSGSFATQALSELLDCANWADAVLLTDNFGRNSETAILLEKFIDKYAGFLTLSGDSLDYFLDKPEILERENTLIVADLQQLQKLSAASRFTQAFTSDMGILKLVDILHDFSNQHKAILIFPYEDSIAIGYKGKVVTTNKTAPNTLLGAHTATWWLQNPGKPLEACASAIFTL